MLMEDMQQQVKSCGQARFYRITPAIAIRAGLYAKEEFSGGIAGRIIYATAEVHGLTICTGDMDFKNLSDIMYIGK
jgi:PIN domain nuclease of toxin-antitoxin system